MATRSAIGPTKEKSPPIYIRVGFAFVSTAVLIFFSLFEHFDPKANLGNQIMGVLQYSIMQKHKLDDLPRGRYQSVFFTGPTRTGKIAMSITPFDRLQSFLENGQG